MEPESAKKGLQEGLATLQANLETWAHFLEGEAYRLRNRGRVTDALIGHFNPDGREREILRAYLGFEKSLSAALLEHAERARELRKRFEELLAVPTETPTEPSVP